MTCSTSSIAANFELDTLSEPLPFNEAVKGYPVCANARDDAGPYAYDEKRRMACSSTLMQRSFSQDCHQRAASALCEWSGM